jgi:hypothetical protein
MDNTEVIENKILCDFFQKMRNNHPLLQLKFIEDIIIDGSNLFPLNIYSEEELNSNEIPCYINKIKNQYDNNKIINNLEENTIYFVISHTYADHILHNVCELLQTLQIFVLYCNNTIINNKYNFKIICKPKDLYHSKFSVETKNLMGLNDKIIIANNTTYYKGNFVYLYFSQSGFGYFKQHNQNVRLNTNYLDDLNCYIKKEDYTIFKRMIEVANEKCKGMKTYSKLWISRRDLNIDSYWHKRFLTNISDVSELILSKGFHEIHFPLDFWYQIYLMNNVDVVFSETGASSSNIFFMKDNALFITNNDPHCYHHTAAALYFCYINKVRFLLYDDCVADTGNKYYINKSNTLNNPYKIRDIEHFKQWFIDWGL